MVSTGRSFSLQKAIRPNILALEPYRCARDDFEGGDGVILLDANENALGHALPPTRASTSTSTSTNAHDDEGAFDNLDLHRYPSPSHVPIKQLVCKLRSVPSPDNVFLGVGSDEVIDLLFRIACAPGRDRVLVCPPTYGMYSVCAQVNDVEVVKVPLDVTGGSFQPQTEKINEIISGAAASNSPVKLVFLCSPGNPTGTLIPLSAIRAVLANPDYQGLVVVDEAYIDFGDDKSSAVRLLVEEGWDNLVVMQTLSKGFGLAAIRLGIAFAAKDLIQVLNNVKAPYNVSTPTASLALRALSPQGVSLYRKNIAILLENRTWLAEQVVKLPSVLGLLGANDANFLLVQIGLDGKPNNEKAKAVYFNMATDEKVVCRFRGNEIGCEGCVRITVGTRAECETVVEKLAQLL